MKILEQHSVGLGKMNQEEIEPLNWQPVYRERTERDQNSKALKSRTPDFLQRQIRKIENCSTVAMPPQKTIEIKRSIWRKLAVRLREEGLFIK
jgi:hypothetical protein